MTPIDLNELAPEEITNRTQRSYKAAALIRLSLEDGPLIQTRGINDSMALWDRLKALYEPKGFSSEFLTCKELFSTTLAKCGNSMEGYLTKVKGLTDDLAARHLAIPNKVIAAYTLNNLTPEYEHTVAIISQSYRASDSQIDLISLFSQLVDESRRIRAIQPMEMALPSKTDTNIGANPKKDRPKCSYCQKIGHNENKCWVKNPGLRPKGNISKGYNPSPKRTSETEISLNSEEMAL